jgi:predicted helicase
VLRDEVLVSLRDEKGPVFKLAKEWRATLFPDANDETFADGYAQTFTYALLLARLEGAPAPLTAQTAATELNDDHALLAEALLLLGQKRARDDIGMPVELLERVIGAVDADKLNAEQDPWLYFYEDFLAAYDPVQRNNRGVYYTPFQVVSAQVRLCHKVLVERFGMATGFAEPDVVVLDPAVGTGTYPLTVVDHALDEAVADFGEGVRAQYATQLARNVNGFEILVGPYAVSHLRLSRTLAAAGADVPDSGVHIYLTDTLASPTHEGFADQASLFEQRLASEQEAASRIKSPDTNVTVIIGNPPYDRDESQTKKSVRRKGGMVRYADDGKSPGLIEDFLAPLRAAGGGGHAKNIYNDYVYFWRWAIWKACNQHNGPSIVSYITASSYLTGPGFAGMREVMRREFDELWLLDLGGEGRGTRKDDNVFEGVLSPVVIAIAVRLPEGDPEARRSTPAVVRYRRVTGSREEKYAALDALSDLDPDDGWELAPDGWLDRFVPMGTEDFDAWPLLTDLMPWQHSGVQFKRSWPIAESEDVLAARWRKLLTAQGDEQASLLRETGDRKVTKGQTGLHTHEELPAIANCDASATPEKVAVYGFRSFDRQWCLADNRLADRPRPELWGVVSEHQLFLGTLTTDSLGAGPALTVSAHTPDLHFFSGRGGKDIIPVWCDDSASQPNFSAELLGLLTNAYGAPVAPEDVVAYIFGLLGTGAYTQRFADELATSAPRVPLTTEYETFQEVVELGRDLLWWATYGERFQPVDDKGLPRTTVPTGSAKNTVAVPTSTYPETYSYDEGTKTVKVGDGEFGPVEPAVWNYEVSGLKVVQSWLGYRMKNRSGKKSSPLDDIRPTSWSFSTEFVKLLSIIEHFVAAETRASALLVKVTEGDLVEPSDIPTPTDDQRKAPKRTTKTLPGGATQLPL